MRLRDVFVGTVVLCIATAHFMLQWFGWKLHIGEVSMQGSLLAPPHDYLWSLSSFPVFSVVPRRMQYHYFITLLLANSLLWGIVIVHSLGFVGHSLARRWRRSRAKTPPKLSQADELAELRWLSDRGMISAEQYRLRREVILARPPETPAAGLTPGTRLEPRGGPAAPRRQREERAFVAPGGWSRGLARGR
jgi:uncharacterized membrane protein